MKRHKRFLPSAGLLLIVLSSSQALAQVSFVKTIGTAQTSSTGTSTTITVPASGVAAGNSVILTLAMNPASGAVTCSDTRGNAYTANRDVTNGSGTSGVRTVVLSTHNIIALASGNTISCTHPSVTARALSANEFSGLAATSTVDAAASATGNSTSPSSGNTPTTTQASELLIGGIGVEGPSGDTFTAGASYATIGRAGTSGGGPASNITINPEYRIVGVTGAYSATATLSSSRGWAAAIVTYKAAPPVATTLVVTSVNSGSNPTAGVGFAVVAQSQTAGGTPANVVNPTGVSLSLKTGSGTLGGTLTGTIATGNNQVTITGVTYTKAESGVVLTANRTSGDSLTASDSAPFTVNPGAATKLAFSTQPGNSTAGSVLSGPPTVVVQDSLGNTVTSSTASIAIAIGTNPGGGTLSGTTPKNAAGGVASFSDLSINQPGTGYTLTATSAGLTSATSSAFNVSATTGTVGGTVVRASDSQPISGALVEALQSGVLKGSATTATNGSYSISNLAVGSYSIRASSAGYGTQTQNGQSVSAGTTTTVNFSLVSAPNITGVSPSSGVIATVATISGTGFGATQGPSTVTFNGTSATPSNWTDTSIVAPVPSGASTGPIVITVAGVASNGATFTVQGSGSVIYIYDELGRLRAVTDPNSDTAVYSYDAVGNLLSISRQNSALVSVIEFSPSSGPAGTTVTIYGTGFSATPSQNTVAFNGLTAAVVSATATRIVATVPAGATTGPIAVTAPAGSATSSKNFTVGNLLAPMITSFTPTIGTAGTPVTITGTNFQTTPSANSLRFNITPASVAGATATSISTAVPTLTGSGRISVGTLYGRATSSADFFIPPSPYTPADIEYTGRMSIGGPSHTVTIATANKNGLVVFDGTAGQLVGLGVNSSTVWNFFMYIYKPDGTLLAQGWANVGTNLYMTLPVTGTYTILFDPNGASVGSVTFTLTSQLNAGTIVIDGPSATVTTTRVAQRATLTFAGVAGQIVGLGVNSSTFSSLNMHFYNPNGTQLTWGGAGTGTNFDMTLPVTGTYTILFDPNGTSTGSATVTLSSRLDAGTIVIDGASVTVTTTRVGQRATLTFAGVAGQIVGLGVNSSTFSSLNMHFYNPNGTQLTWGGAGTGTNFDMTLPVTGTYTILFDPNGTSTGSATVQLKNIITLTVVYNGKLRDRVRPGDTGLTPDGALDGTFTVTLPAGSGSRTVTSIELRSSNGGVWDTQPSGFWALGAANSLDGALHNAANATVSFPVADGGSFNVFASDSGSTYFNSGMGHTLNVIFDVGRGRGSSTVP